MFERYPLKTHLITPNDKLSDVIGEYVMPLYQEGDILVMSERMVAITQGRLVHESEIKVSVLAKFLVKFVKKWRYDPGFSDPKKMQVVINIVGIPRILLASLMSALTKPLGIRGLFYSICGHEVAQIDGFAPGTIPPYDQYAVLGPENPAKVCNELKEKFNLPFAIVDANNIDVEILGVSDKLPISKEDLRLAFLDNPIGQGLEQTPVCLVREVSDR